MQKRKSIPILLFVILSLLLVSADDVRLARFEIINKSGMEIAVGLTGLEYEELYYLRLAEGTRADPVAKTFTLVPDNYYMQVYYLEYWDPVYGFKCGRQAPLPFDIIRNVRLVVIECDRMPLHKGEPPAIRKYPLTPRFNFIF
jgi:hypothetical protein